MHTSLTQNSGRCNPILRCSIRQTQKYVWRQQLFELVCDVSLDEEMTTATPLKKGKWIMGASVK